MRIIVAFAARIARSEAGRRLVDYSISASVAILNGANDSKF